MSKKDSAGSVVFLGLLGTGVGVLAIDHAFSDPGLSMIDRFFGMFSSKKPEVASAPATTPALPAGGKMPDWLSHALPSWMQPGATQAPVAAAPLYPAAGFDPHTVSEVQQRLDALNLPELRSRLDALKLPSIPSWVPLPLKVDGVFGDRTKAVLKALQGALGLSPTGLPDPQTLQVLRDPNILTALQHALGTTAKTTAAPKRRATVQSHSLSAPPVNVPLSQSQPPVTYSPYPMPSSLPLGGAQPGGYASMPQPRQQPTARPGSAPQYGSPSQYGPPSYGPPPQPHPQTFGIPGLGSATPAPWLLELGQELGLVRTGAAPAPGSSPGVIALPAPLPAAVAAETAQLGPSAQAVISHAISSETDQATLLDLAGKLAASNMPKAAQAMSAKVTWSATRTGWGGGMRSPWLPGEPRAIGWW